MEKNRLWWLGLFISLLGVILNMLMFFPELSINLLDIISNENLTDMSDTGNHAFRFGVGFGSAVMIGWGLTLIVVSQYYTELARRYLAYGIFAWYILDSLVSYLTQFYINIVSNTGLLILGIFVLYTQETKKFSLIDG